MRTPKPQVPPGKLSGPLPESLGTITPLNLVEALSVASPAMRQLLTAPEETTDQEPEPEKVKE